MPEIIARIIAPPLAQLLSFRFKDKGKAKVFPSEPKGGPLYVDNPEETSLREPYLPTIGNTHMSNSLVTDIKCSLCR
jgi:hypothetical protein